MASHCTLWVFSASAGKGIAEENDGKWCLIAASPLPARTLTRGRVNNARGGSTGSTRKDTMRHQYFDRLRSTFGAADRRAELGDYVFDSLSHVFPCLFLYRIHHYREMGLPSKCQFGLLLAECLSHFRGSFRLRFFIVRHSCILPEAHQRRPFPGVPSQVVE